jgi:hypothetical protein
LPTGITSFVIVEKQYLFAIKTGNINLTWTKSVVRGLSLGQDIALLENLQAKGFLLQFIFVLHCKFVKLNVVGIFATNIRVEFCGVTKLFWVRAAANAGASVAFHIVFYGHTKNAIVLICDSILFSETLSPFF